MVRFSGKQPRQQHSPLLLCLALDSDLGAQGEQPSGEVRHGPAAPSMSLLHGSLVVVDKLPPHHTDPTRMPRRTTTGREGGTPTAARIATLPRSASSSADDNLAAAATANKSIEAAQRSTRSAVSFKRGPGSSGGGGGITESTLRSAVLPCIVLALAAAGADALCGGRRCRCENSGLGAMARFPPPC